MIMNSNELMQKSSGTTFTYKNISCDTIARVVTLKKACSDPMLSFFPQLASLKLYAGLLVCQAGYSKYITYTHT